ncbi:MAG TPA: IS3 family transposase [Bacteroidetes bacterium]|nr:IS3 family transposase [Bacteroidota bacterium]
MIDKSDPKLSVRKQCDILGLNRTGIYYKPRKESALNLELMRKMDEHYLENSFKGARRMHVWLTMDLGYRVSLNRISRLYYKVMCLRAIAPGPHTSKRHKKHEIYPYLLRELSIERKNQVWSTDITYIPMNDGFMYLTAVIDVHTRYVLNWSLSNTMDAEWCQKLIEGAIAKHVHPEILNTDQGSQYTSDVFSKYVLDVGIKLSMDGKGRATDNAFIERLWRTVNYENVYMNEYRDGNELYTGLSQFFENYNNKRRHSSIKNKRPVDLFLGQRA